jgi:hypothetical protein
MNASSTPYVQVTNMPFGPIAGPAFLKPKCKHLLAELANVKELGNVLLVFSDAMLHYISL